MSDQSPSVNALTNTIRETITNSGTLIDMSNANNSVGTIDGAPIDVITNSSGSLYLSNYSASARTNTINGNINVTGGRVHLNKQSTGNLTNHILGSITIANSGVFGMDDNNPSTGTLSNTIDGTITNSGDVNMYNADNSVGTVGDLLIDVITNTAGVLSMYNDSSQAHTNTINGNIQVSGGWVYMYKRGSGNFTNHVLGSVTNSGTLRMDDFHATEGALTNIIEGTITNSSTFLMSNADNTIGTLDDAPADVITNSAGTLNIYNNSAQEHTNIINGNIRVNSGAVNLYKYSSGNLTNIIHGSIANTATLDMRDYSSAIGMLTNTIDGTITNSRTLDMYSANNTVGTIAGAPDDVITNTAGTLSMYNSSSQERTNTINGNIRVHGGTAYMDKYGSGGLTNHVLGSINNAGSLIMRDFASSDGTLTNTIDGTIANSGTLSMYSANNTVGTLAGAPTDVMTNTAGTLSMYNSSSQERTNTINGNMQVNGGTVNMYKSGSGNLTNNVHGAINNAGTLGMYDDASSIGTLANTIDGTITNSGSLQMSSADNTVGTLVGAPADVITNNGSGILMMFNSSTNAKTNTINGNIQINSGSVYMNKYSSGTLTNQVLGSVTVTGGAKFDANSSSNTIEGLLSIQNNGQANFHNLEKNGAYSEVANTFTTGINLNNGTLSFGGPQSTTNIDTFTWQRGTVQVFSGSSSQFGFGTTRITNMNFPATGAVPDKALLISVQGAALPEGSGEYVLFSCDNYTGDPLNVWYENATGLFDITLPPGAVKGFKANGAGGSYVIVVTPVLVGNNAAATDSSTVGIANNMVQNISGPARGGMTDFRFTPALQHAFYELQRQHKREGEKNNSFKDMLQVIAEANQGVPFIKQVANYKIWMTPYYSHTHNNTMWQKGFSENIYGLMLGGSKHLKDQGITFGLTVGSGLSKTKMKARRENHTEGKQFLLGASFLKSFNKKFELIANITGLTSYYESQRFGNPLPDQTYLAKSKYHTLVGDAVFEAGYIFWLPHKLSIRPEIGLESTVRKRYGYTERDAGNNAQTYKSKVTKDNEVYTGLSIRKTVTGDTYEAKFTCLYEIGLQTNRRRKSDMVYVASAPSGVRFTVPTAGNVTHYVNTYFSILNMEYNFKVYAGVLSTIQHHQKSFMFSIKAEYRF